MPQLRPAVIAAVVASCIAAAIAPAPRAHAALVVGNMNAPFDGLSVVGSSNVKAASSFTLGPTFIPANVTSVTLAVGTSVPGTVADAFLCFDNAGRPGATAVSLGSVLAPNVFTGVTFTPVTLYTLQPSTKYWVVLAHEAGSGDLQWVQNAGTTADAGSNPAATLQNPPGNLMTFDSGANWSAFGPNANMTFHFAVQATVPAPMTPGVLGAAGLLAVRRRRR